MSRLQELGFTDFTGGLNVRDNRSFQIADNESPQMLNMRADERLGIYTRKGMARWNATEITAGTWNPRNGFEHDFSDGTSVVFVTNQSSIWAANNTTTFTRLEYSAADYVNCNAEPHLADFASWGDVVYVATGRKIDVFASSDKPIRYNKAGTVTGLNPTALGTFNDDYTVPVKGVMPQADYVAAHAGYLFCASIKENYDGSIKDYPSRVRWSHPNSPEDWAKLDFLDIEAGGGRITGLLPFRDHLLIFKTDSVWALYGYDSESWQLVRVSGTLGTPSATTLATSPMGVFFYSTSGSGGIYMYQGETPTLISDAIETPVEEIPANRITDVWAGWASNRLMVSIPWVADWDPVGGNSTTHSSLFIWDPQTGGGTWEMHRPAKGSIGPIIERSDSTTENSLLVLYGADVDSCLLKFESVDSGAYDIIDDLVTPAPFKTLYATNWKFDNTPELRKHWMRPRFIVRTPPNDVTLLIEVFHDYDESEPKRTFQLDISATGQYYWRALGFADPAGDGFDWEPTDPAGRGGIWSGSARGGRIVRGKSFGIARSVQVVFSTTPSSIGQEWGLDAVILKYVPRRFTT